MEVWTLEQITNPEFKKMLSQDIDSITGLVDLQLSDGTIRVSKRQAFMNLFWWPIITVFNIPLRKDHFIKNMAYSADKLYQEWDRYYDEIMSITSHNAKVLKQTIWNVLQDMYYFGCIDLSTYVASLDIIDMSQITTEPIMADIIKTKYNLIDKDGNLKATYSTRDVETIIDGHGKEIIKLLGTKDSLQNQRLLPFQRTEQLNKHQVPQTMYCFGVRTDINDAIIKKVVIGSALDGIRDIEEYAVESLSAKKTAFYNKHAVKESQYYNRRMQLNAAAVRQLYEGDCGSTNTVAFRVSESKKNNVIGKYIIDGGQLVCLTKYNIDNYVGKLVQLRSPMTCRYRNGVCEVCGGRIYSNLNFKLNPGIIAAMHVDESVTQKILSAKHLVKTSSIIYHIPTEFNGKIFTAKNTSEIWWHTNFLGKSGKIDDDMMLGIPYDSFRNFTDVKLIRKDSVREASMSSITNLYIRKGDKIVADIDMLDRTLPKPRKNVPALSLPMLLHVRDSFDKLVHADGCIWIPLSGTEYIPIMVTKIINDNMLEYVKSVDSFFKSTIAKFRTNSTALEAASDIIYTHVDVNIAHIETVLKAFQITSEDDYSIPLVEDTNDVHFSDINKIFEYRTVGGKLAFESLQKYIQEPSTYLNNRQKSVFDYLIGYVK